MDPTISQTQEKAVTPSEDRTKPPAGSVPPGASEKES